MIYVNLENTLFNEAKSEDSICQVASSKEKVTKLIEASFAYVASFNNELYFRKRK